MSSLSIVAVCRVVPRFSDWNVFHQCTEANRASADRKGVDHSILAGAPPFKTPGSEVMCVLFDRQEHKPSEITWKTKSV